MTSSLAALIVVSSTAVVNLPRVEMEKAYWDCEFAATEGFISLDTAAGCSEIYEDLKRRKFDGRFDRFLVWWRENKTREMSLRAARGRMD